MTPASISPPRDGQETLPFVSLRHQMYAIITLDPAAAQRFEALAPYEVRHIVRGLSRLPHVHAVGATLFGAPVGLALATEASDAWSAPGVVRLGDPSGGRLLAITVARSHRRMGVGQSLLSAIERALLDRGVGTLGCSYALRPETGLEAVEGLFRKTGWSAPEITMLQCRADNALLEAPIVRELPPLPPEYRICDWVDVSDSERDQIIEHQRRDPWYPHDLDPFHFEPDLEVMNSLALRYNGEVVGWLLTHSTTPTIIQYRCLFVRADLARLGRGLSMLREAILRHWRAIAPAQGAGEWSTPSSLPLMIRFIRRHLEPFGAVVTEQKLVRKVLRGTKRATGNGQRATEERALETPKPKPVARHAFLSPDETEKIRVEVLSARDLWTARVDTLPCFTFGAAAMFDARDGAEAYERRAMRGNALLSSRFPWLYDRLRDALASALGGAVEYDAARALPGFRIQRAARGSHLPVLAVRSDRSHVLVYPGATLGAPPVSFAVCITPLQSERAMTFWELQHADTVGLDSEETARLLEGVQRSDADLEPGALVVFGSDQFHQSAPLRDAPKRGERIVLSGHAVLLNGAWRVYG
jgi:GNAT superfamily N-acetyltransferase